MKTAFWPLSLLISACAIVQPLSQRGTLILKPQIQPGGQTQTVIPVYSKASINHLLLKVFTTDNGEQDTGIQLKVPNVNIDNPVVLSNLKPNTHYRIRAIAYFTSDETQPISNGSSYADITVGNDDRPTVGSIPVYLIDRLFDGLASSTIVINEGTYSPASSESMKFAGIEGIVTTFAGSGSVGTTDGQGTAAQFNQPHDLTIDSQGNLYIADDGNNLIRKVTPSGQVTTLAGSVASGSTDATGTNATFYRPIAITKGPNALYVADYSNRKIRKVTLDGVVTTFAGSGEVGGADGQGTGAQFYGPHSICAAPDGSIYVGDANGWQRIRKISPTGLVTTVAGGGVAGSVDGEGTAASFNNPAGLTLDSQGNLYIADRESHCIRKMTSTGTVTTIAGRKGIAGHQDGQGTFAIFYRPDSITLDNRGNLYVADYGNNYIRMISSTGWVSTIAGNGTAGAANGTGTSATFATPAGIVYGPQDDLYLAEIGNSWIRRIQ